MALNLKNPEVERLAAEVARMAGETKTEAIRRALLDRKARLAATSVRTPVKDRLTEYLERSVWPQIAPELLGRPISKQEEDEILGYGPEGF
jgi:antitoxin VapB